MSLTFNILRENFSKDSNEIINFCMLKPGNSHERKSYVWGDSSIASSVSRSKRTKAHKNIRNCLRGELLRSQHKQKTTITNSFTHFKPEIFYCV